jgi:hypothetical protein
MLMHRYSDAAEQLCCAVALALLLKCLTLLSRFLDDPVRVLKLLRRVT